MGEEEESSSGSIGYHAFTSFSGDSHEDATLPFTFGVDMGGIDCAVSLAESAGATLVPVSLIPAPPEGARLELIQQSKDFLEAVQNKAEMKGGE